MISNADPAEFCFKVLLGVGSRCGSSSNPQSCRPTASSLLANVYCTDESHIGQIPAIRLCLIIIYVIADKVQKDQNNLVLLLTAAKESSVDFKSWFLFQILSNF